MRRIEDNENQALSGSQVQKKVERVVTYLRKRYDLGITVSKERNKEAEILKDEK